MKRFIFLFVALLCCVSATAQVVFVATLQHESTTTQYYGQDALTSAYKAAVDGDVITLSDGTFTWRAGDFNKSITLRGAGNITKDKRSIVTNDFHLTTRNKEIKTIIEGLYFNNSIEIYNEDAQYEKGTIELIKCRFNNLNSTYSGNPTKNSPKVFFYNCIIDGIMNFNSAQAYPKYNFINCYVGNLYSISTLGNNTSMFSNCVINFKSHNYGGYGNYYASSVACNYLSFANCILIYYQATNSSGNKYVPMPNTATAINCLSINYDGLFNNLFQKENCMTATSSKEVFKTFTDDCGVGETFELTDEAKAKYLGNDSTQVGMQGGVMPFNTTVSYPIITKFEADNYTTKDGKLTINVEVDGKK